MQHDLTDRYLKALKAPTSGRIEVSDTKRAGLRFRLSASGNAVWMYEKRVKGGPKRKHTLGAWPEPVSLSQARAMALEIEAEAAKGIDRVEISDLDKKRILRAIERELKAKGMVPSDNPDRCRRALRHFGTSDLEVVGRAGAGGS